jgi:drug/metabolite transporter (DMT)-like permease
MEPARLNYLIGAVFGVAAGSIWAGWSAVTRLAVTTSLDAWDIPALRFGVAGLLLLPIVIRRGRSGSRFARVIPGRDYLVPGPLVEGPDRLHDLRVADDEEPPALHISAGR